MTVFVFLLGMAECFLLWALGRSGASLGVRATREWEQAKYLPPDGWPTCALIIPVGGTQPQTEAALRSMLEQDYPDYTPYIVTAADDQTPAALLERLAEDYPRLRLVSAPEATKCGQKNANLLAGVQAAGNTPDVYVFCDSTHLARFDFLRCLLNPIARGEAAFTTGYHEVEPRDSSLITLGYAMSVLFMRFMQGVAAFTQPWGGALAMKRSAFERYDVATLWATNVVDDCSLAPWLHKAGARICLCPGALLRTMAGPHPCARWRAWLERQVLFLKFCLPGQWICLVVLSLLLFAPPVWACVACLRGLLGLGGGMAPFLALCWACITAWIIDRWRRFLPVNPPPGRWLMAYVCACAMFAYTCLQTLFSQTLRWNGIVYHVGAGGVVKGIDRP